MIHNVITSRHKKASNNIKKQINIDGKQILKIKEVLNRLEKYGENNSFINLKDQIENFNNVPTVRLINPAKGKLARINNAILDTASKNIFEKLWV